MAAKRSVAPWPLLQSAWLKAGARCLLSSVTVGEGRVLPETHLGDPAKGGGGGGRTSIQGLTAAFWLSACEGDHSAVQSPPGGLWECQDGSQQQLQQICESGRGLLCQSSSRWAGAFLSAPGEGKDVGDLRGEPGIPRFNPQEGRGASNRWAFLSPSFSH